MAHAGKEFGLQYAAIPYEVVAQGPRILLLTSRNTRRWVIPKGWPIRGLKPREVAAREAFEEAGLIGRIVGKRPVGSYFYTKQRGARPPRTCHVRVFLLSVDYQVEDWPEKAQRDYRWVDPLLAAQMVREPDLADLLRTALPSTGPMRAERSALLRF